MTNQQKVLTELRKQPAGKLVSYSFSAMSRDLAIPREELDSILNNLEKNRDIDQWIMKGHDEFSITLR